MRAYCSKKQERDATFQDATFQDDEMEYLMCEFIEKPGIDKGVILDESLRQILFQLPLI